jgi:ketosteroid isomerase-like protein
MHVTRGLLAILMALLIGAQSSFAQAPAPSAVVESYERARAQGDVDAALATFADGAVVTVQGRDAQSFTGRDQVRVFLQTLGLEFQTIMKSAPHVEGTVVSWTEREQAPRQSVDAQVQAVVSAGQITSLRYVQGEPFGGFTRPAPPAPPAAAPGPRELPSAAWPAALALVCLTLLVLVFGRPRGQASRSELDGRLLSSMQRARQCDDAESKAA